MDIPLPVSYTHLNGDSWNDTLPITLTEPFAFAPYQVPDGEDEPSEAVSYTHLVLSIA